MIRTALQPCVISNHTCSKSSVTPKGVVVMCSHDIGWEQFTAPQEPWHLCRAALSFGNVIAPFVAMQAMCNAALCHVCRSVLCCLQRVSAVSPSPTDQMFASCSDDNTVKVWDLATGTATTFAGNLSCLTMHITRCTKCLSPVLFSCRVRRRIAEMTSSFGSRRYGLQCYRTRKYKR